jgi:hypothetical protein
MNVPLFNGTGWAATTPSDTGWANELMYSTPNFGGLSANIHYQFGEVQGNSGPKNVGFNVLYFNGPFAATMFYERDQISNPTTPAPFATGDKKTDMMVGASYDAKVVKGFVTYGRAKSDRLVPTAKTVSLGASVPVGLGKVLVGGARTERDAGQHPHHLDGGLRLQPVQEHRRVRHVHARQDQHVCQRYQLRRRYPQAFLIIRTGGGSAAAVQRKRRVAVLPQVFDHLGQERLAARLSACGAG